MAHTPDVAIYARVTLVDGQRAGPAPLSYGDRRVQFWADVFRRAGRELPPDEGEFRVERELPRILSVRFADRGRRNLRKKASPSDPVFFRVEIIDYGSSLWKIEIPGFDTVTKFVDDNYDLFMFLTECHFTSGFESLFGLQNGSVKTELQASELLRSAFPRGATDGDSGGLPEGAQGGGAGEGGPPTSAGGSGRANDPLSPGEKRLQRIIKGTLVLVLLVLIGTAWLLAYAWNQERDAQREERKHIAEERKALLDLAASEVKIVSDRNVELAKVLAQGAASEVLALVHGYGALAHDSTAGPCCCSACCPTSSSKKKPPTSPQCKAARQ